MSSKIIVDTIEKKTGDDVTLVGNLDVPTSYKITGTDADSIQAPGLITSAGGGLNSSLNTGLASATFPAGHVIKTIYRNFGHWDNTSDSGVSSSNMTATSPTVCTDSNGVQNYYGTITGLTVGNDVMVTMHFHPNLYIAGKICSCTFYIFKDGTSTSNIIYGGKQTDGSPRSLFQYTEGSVSEVALAAPATLVHIDQNVQSTSATYYLGYDTNASLNFYSNYGGYTCIMQEIQG